MTDEEFEEATYVIKVLVCSNSDGDYASKMEDYYDNWFAALHYRIWTDGIREGLELAEGRAQGVLDEWEDEMSSDAREWVGEVMKRIAI
jgi:hypothetical protein